jgi:hypothetical protein
LPFSKWNNPFHQTPAPERLALPAVLLIKRTEFVTLKTI